MNNEHINAWLDGRDAGDWTDAEIDAASHHASACEDCRQVWLAAQAARALLQARCAHSLEVPPAFSARVMAAVRDNTPVPLLSRLWLANARLVYGLAASFLILAIFSLKEELALRKHVASEADLDTGSMVMAYDLAMGDSDEDGFSN